MANVRVYELAKELGIPNKDLIARLAAAGVEVKSHSSSITAEQADLMRGGAQPAAAAEPAPAPAPEPVPAPAPEPAPAPAPAGDGGAGESMEFIVDPTDPGAPARVSAGRKPAPKPAAKMTPLPPPPKKKPLPPPPPRKTTPPPVAKPKPEPAAKPAAAPKPAPAAKPAAQPAAAAPAPAAAGLRIERGATVQEYAELVDKTAASVVKMLLDLGEMKTATQSMTDEEIELISTELGIEVTVVSPDEAEHEALAAEEEEELADDPDAVLRPPVVTVMGHVDHGKTSILDRIRTDDANVAEGEAGGITQHIGAYQVRNTGHPITFIDTPGHEAFTAMRARGAAVTDIAVLVVAADDGVMPQTLEAISHAKAAKVPIVVAVNKIDKEDADPSRVRQQLAEHELVPSEWGGDTEFVDVSAKSDLNIDGLLDTITIVAEMEELKANPDRAARGVAIEAHLDKGRGPVATVIVRRGTLRVGDAIVCGSAFGKVRAMLDENGQPMAEAGPAAPAQILGFATVPAAGDDFKVVDDEREARQIAQERESKDRRADMVAVPGALTSLENLFDRVQAGEVSELVLIVKADVQGSLEALTDALVKLDTGEVKTKIIHRAVGAITENDVRLAEASGGLIIGFNVRPDRTARALAEKEGVDIRTYRVIYEAVESIESALKGMLAPEFEEIVTGQAEVRQLFRVPKIGVVNGCYVIEGSINRNARVRVLRDGLVVFDGVMASLRRFKDDVKDVNSGYECGIGVENFQDTKEGDVIEAYELRQIER